MGRGDIAEMEDIKNILLTEGNGHEGKGHESECKQCSYKYQV